MTNINTKKWTPEQEQQLLDAAVESKSKESKLNWKKIGKQFDRPPVMCYNKFIQLTNADWSKQEIERLIGFYRSEVKVHDFVSTLDWSAFENHFPKRPLKAIQFKLEQLCQKNTLRPKFQMTKDMMFSLPTEADTQNKTELKSEL